MIRSEHFLGRSSCPSNFAARGPSHDFSSSYFLRHHILYFSHSALSSNSAIPSSPIFGWKERLHTLAWIAWTTAFCCITSAFHFTPQWFSILQRIFLSAATTSALCGQPEPQLMTLCLQFPFLTQPALGGRLANLAALPHPMAFFVTCREPTTLQSQAVLRGYHGSRTRPITMRWTQPCGGVATGYAPHASKPIPWGFTRAQPIQIHASDFGTLKMALFPPTSTSYQVFLDLRRLSPRKVPIHVPHWTPLQHPYSPSSTARAVHVPHHLVSISSSQEYLLSRDKQDQGPPLLNHPQTSAGSVAAAMHSTRPWSTASSP